MMTTQQKREKIKELSIKLLNDSHEAMLKNIDKVLNSGAVDCKNWLPENMPLIIPKCIATAILLEEGTQYDCKGTAFEKQVTSEVKNIRYFI